MSDFYKEMFKYFWDETIFLPTHIYQQRLDLENCGSCIYYLECVHI